ncbi:nucleoside 2-deoxyribosyltransferase domain-containing protein [Nostoc sp. CHAB 5834]|nr:nucleoside 2-deoxyribosyltransferase domain-containing protein [Nostoc sp. CHAB 5834]
MQVVYAQAPLETSIFLAGPTPRDKQTPSWRPEAVHILKELGFQGKVFLPETESGVFPPDSYDKQIQWEWEALNQATVVIFWVPRKLKDMPAFTTNTEFGLLASSSKLLLGFPPEAEKMRYLDRLAQRYQIPVFETLRELLSAASMRTQDPYPLNRASRDIPL